MKIIKAGFEILTKIDSDEILKTIELAGKTCYKSEQNITSESAKEFVRKLIKSSHLAMIEHASVSVKVICDRGVSHEIVRHRVASYAQESTRYVNYSKGKYNREITVIEPLFFERGSPQYHLWRESCEFAEECYMELITLGAAAQEARSVLPNSLKTEIVVTMNLRSWRNFFELRAIGTTGKPHPQMLEIAIPMLKEFQRLIPIVFDDLEVK